MNFLILIFIFSLFISSCKRTRGGDQDKELPEWKTQSVDYRDHSVNNIHNPKSKSPYPQSEIIKGLEWDPGVHKIEGSSGDNWPITWVNDSLQIASYGDGDGFDNEFPDLTIGISYIIGDPLDLRGKDIVSSIDTPEGEGSAGIKASGLLMTGGELYLFVRNYKPENSDDFTNSRLAWSEDKGKTFQWADWHFKNSFGCPDFIQFGPDYKNAMDDYVYIVSQDNDNAYRYSPGIVLAKVQKDSIRYRESYAFFAGINEDQPLWTADINNRHYIFYNPTGTQRVSMAYNPALQRFILASSHQPEGDTRTHTDALGVFESENPWGPWRTVYYSDDWSEDCRTYHHRFPVKWMSRDGNEMWLLYSGLDCNYYGFCLKKAYVKR